MSQKSTSIRPAILAPMGLKADAALFFVENEVVFQGVGDDGVEQIKFISPATLREAFAKEPMDSGWLPPGVNRCGSSSKGDWMLRWYEPAIYTVRLEDRKQPLRVPMPSLIWFGIKHNYYIFAAREAKFTPNAALYAAPVANVSSHGLICFGKNAHPDVARGGFEKAWRTFWDAPFNNDHDDGKSKAFPDAINQQLQKLAREKATTYPVKDLVSMQINLEAAIHRLTRRDRS
jgi:PRTRC genetic system protein B